MNSRALIILSILTLWLYPHATNAANCIDQYSYVFVLGYGNEKIQGYGTENVAHLRAMGASQVSLIKPSSSNTIEENVPLVRNELLAQAAGSVGRPLVIIAHSKGAIESFHSIVRSLASFDHQVLHRLFLVQAPLLGSPYADHVMRSFDNSIWALNPLYWFYRPTYRGFQSMLTKETHRSIRQSELEAMPKLLQGFAERLFYIRSTKAPAEVSRTLSPYEKITSLYGENDGLVVAEKARLESFGGFNPFGQDLEIDRDADHHDYFVMNSSAPRSRGQKVREFTEQIVRLSCDESSSIR